MKQKRHLLIGGVGLVKGKIRNDGIAMVAVCDFLEPLLAGCLNDAPFDTISLIIRYGAESKDEIEIGRIDQFHAELPVAVQVDIAEFQSIQSDSTELRSAFLAQTIRALHAVAEKYNLRELTGILREHPTTQWS